MLARQRLACTRALCMIAHTDAPATERVATSSLAKGLVAACSVTVASSSGDGGDRGDEGNGGDLGCGELSESAKRAASSSSASASTSLAIIRVRA